MKTPQDNTGNPLAAAPVSVNYDSSQETIEHILRVRELLYVAQNKLQARGFAHDKSKLGPNEKPIFDRVTGKLRGLTYGSDEYKASLKDLGPALTHHYANNSHHPEHFENGVEGMSLFDVLEMLCDWKAAGERHANGNINRSLAVNRDRFKISDQLNAILENTVRELGWTNSEVSVIPPNVPLAEALRAVLLLVDDGDLVRNTDGDGDMMTFLQQGMKITSALQKAQVALASANSKVSK